MSLIHASAIIDPKATLGADVTVGPYCIVGQDVQLHDRVKLHSHVVVDGRTDVGEDTHTRTCGGGLPRLRGVSASRKTGPLRHRGADAGDSREV